MTEQQECGPGRPAAPPSRWAALCTAPPGPSGVEALGAADPATMTGRDLLDAIVTSDRLISHLQARQASLLGAFAQPGRAGSVTKLVDELAHRGGLPIDAGARSRQGDPTDDDRHDESEHNQSGPAGAPQACAGTMSQAAAIGLATAEVAAALCTTAYGAACRISTALTLTQHLPDTLAAFTGGRIDRARALLICERTALLDPDLRSKVEAEVLPKAFNRSPSRLRPIIDRAVINADPDAAIKRRQKAIKDRHVRHAPEPDGMGSLHALLPAEAALGVWTLLDLLAGPRDPADPRPVGARRADALSGIAHELLTAGFCDITDQLPDLPEHEPVEPAPPIPFDDLGQSASAGGRSHGAPRDDRTRGAKSSNRSRRRRRSLTRHGRRPHLTVTMELTTLAGLDDQAAHLEGHGAITADLARSIAAAVGSLNAMLLHPTAGTALVVGATTYRPSQSTCDRVLAIAGTCRFIGCNQPAWRCDFDHHEPFDHDEPTRGGLTTEHNLDPLCRRHHLYKHHTGWVPDRRADHSIVWTSPTGRTYLDRPREYRNPTDPDEPCERVWDDARDPDSRPAAVRVAELITSTDEQDGPVRSWLLGALRDLPDAIVNDRAYLDAPASPAEELLTPGQLRWLAARATGGANDTRTQLSADAEPTNADTQADPTDPPPF